MQFNLDKKSGEGLFWEPEEITSEMLRFGSRQAFIYGGIGILLAVILPIPWKLLALAVLIFSGQLAIGTYRLSVERTRTRSAMYERFQEILEIYKLIDYRNNYDLMTIKLFEIHTNPDILEADRKVAKLLYQILTTQREHFNT